MATAVLARPKGLQQVAQKRTKSAPRRSKGKNPDDGVTFDTFYKTYCTGLKEAEKSREAHKAQVQNWKSPDDDDFDSAEKGLLIMDDSDPNVFVRCQRLRQFATWIKDKVDNEDDQIYMAKGIQILYGL